MNWVIENIVKNAVDAMKGIGDLNMQISEKGDSIFIDIKDNGSGMTKHRLEMPLNRDIQQRKEVGAWASLAKG